MNTPNETPTASRLHPQNQLNQARCDLRAAEIAHARWDQSVDEYDLRHLRAEIRRLRALLVLN